MIPKALQTVIDAVKFHQIVPFREGRWLCPKCSRELIPQYNCARPLCYHSIDHLHWSCSCGFGEMITDTWEAAMKKEEEERKP